MSIEKMNKAKPVKQKTVVFQVMEQIKQMIATDILKPGDKVPNEYELAELFGVGRSSIREALKIFQYLGVIELRNPKGTYICESSNISTESLLWSMLLGKKEFANIVELRLVLELQGLWYLLVYNKADQDLLNNTVEKLNQSILMMEEAINENNLAKRIDADYYFHKHIIEICNNDMFNNLYTCMNSFMKEEMYLSHNSIPQKKIVKKHYELVKLIQEGDYYKTVEAVRKHIKDVELIFVK